MIRISILLCILLSSNIHAITNYHQVRSLPSDKNIYYISKIIIEGNKTTKDITILRELAISKNQSITLEELEILITESKNNLTNTNLFNFITIDYNISISDIILKIEVIERWYVWPYPILEVSERNFNTWWQDFQTSDYKDFSRLNYGFFINIENFRGLNELIMIKFRRGFKEHYLLSYKNLFLNKRKTLGLNSQIELFRRKKTYYKTLNNELQYFNNKDAYTSKDVVINFEIVYRVNLKTKQQLNLNYFKTIIDPTISFLNPNYLSNNQTQGSFYKLGYQIIHENRDNNKYPLKGHYINIEIAKNISQESPISHYEINSHLEKHFQFSNRWFGGSSLRSRITSSGEQAYFSHETFGFEDYVRGYEYYIIDGEDYYLSKTAIKYCLVRKKDLNFPYIKTKQFNKAHFSIYTSVFSDFGYANNQSNFSENSLANSILWGKGISLEYVTYYDKMLRIEYSINKLGEKGLFLHFSSPFGVNK